MLNAGLLLRMLATLQRATNESVENKSGNLQEAWHMSGRRHNFDPCLQAHQPITGFARKGQVAYGPLF